MLNYTVILNCRFKYNNTTVLQVNKMTKKLPTQTKFQTIKFTGEIIK